MPGYDKMGPRGMGRRRGRGRGGCATGGGPNAQGGDSMLCMGRSLGQGQGGGRRRSRRHQQWTAAPTPDPQQAWIADEETVSPGALASRLEQQLQAIQDRLAALEGK